MRSENEGEFLDGGVPTIKPACVSDVASARTQGTFTIRARVLASNVFPVRSNIEINMTVNLQKILIQKVIGRAYVRKKISSSVSRLIEQQQYLSQLDPSITHCFSPAQQNQNRNFHGYSQNYRTLQPA